MGDEMTARVQRFLAAGEAAMDARQAKAEEDDDRRADAIGGYIEQCFERGHLQGAIVDYIDTVQGEREWFALLDAVGNEYPAMNPAKVGSLFAKFLADVALRYAEEEVERDEAETEYDEPPE